MEFKSTSNVVVVSVKSSLTEMTMSIENKPQNGLALVLTNFPLENP